MYFSIKAVTEFQQISFLGLKKNTLLRLWDKISVCENLIHPLRHSKHLAEYYGVPL